MKLSESLKTAVVGLRTNKTRSFLTMLGIIIGIGSVVLMLSLGSGVQNLILSQIISLGSNNIFIEPGAWDPKKVSMMEAMVEEFEIKTLKYSDSQAIEELSTVEMTAPTVFGIGKVVYKDVNRKVTFLGTTPSSQKIEGARPVMGRDINESEVKSMAKVAVLGSQLKQDLFGDENPVGKMIKIKRVNFRVIGVLEPLGSRMFMNLDEQVFVPLTTAQKLLLGIDHIRWMVVQAKSDDVVEQAVDDIRLLLRQRHNIYNPEEDLSKDDFRIMTQVEAADTMTSITNILTMFLSSIAAIALIVGGIGIMNIMLVSVTERTREIGLRKAVGARKKDIMRQFLLEALTLTILGGLVGIILGAAFAFLSGVLITKLLGVEWQFVLSVSSIALAFGTAAVIGLIFGIYPAAKASNLSPIEALRYE